MDSSSSRGGPTTCVRANARRLAHATRVHASSLRTDVASERVVAPPPAHQARKLDRPHATITTALLVASITAAANVVACSAEAPAPVVTNAARTTPAAAPVLIKSCAALTNEGVAVVEGRGIRIGFDEFGCLVRQLPPRMRRELSLDVRNGIRAFAQVMGQRKLLAAEVESNDLTESRDAVVRLLEKRGMARDQSQINDYLQLLGARDLRIDDEALSRVNVNEEPRPTDPLPHSGKPPPSVTLEHNVRGKMQVATDVAYASFTSNTEFLFAEDILMLELFASGTLENIAFAMNHRVRQIETFYDHGLGRSSPAGSWRRIDGRARYIPVELSVATDLRGDGGAVGRSIVSVEPLYLACLMASAYRQKEFAGDVTARFEVGLHADIRKLTVEPFCPQGEGKCPPTDCLVQLLNGWRVGWLPASATPVTATIHIDHNGPLTDLNFGSR